jgi:hypothetical protein
MILRNNNTYTTKLSENFRVKEYFVSKLHPHWAYDAFKKCNFQIFNNIRLLAIIQQDIRDYINAGTAYEKRIYNTSGYRDKKLNLAVGGANNSYHLKGMSVDFDCGQDSNYLFLIYDYLQSGIPEHLKPSQVILYQDYKGHSQFIHITIPMPSVKQRAWIEEI